MVNSKNTKRALLTSALAILACVAMLIGTTFAWFTDTASTSVNKIVSGKLSVDIVSTVENEEGIYPSLKGESMDFVNKDGSKDILWEPGATFRTIGFKIKNNGSLALKYKLALTGIQGDSELLKVITFSVVKGENDEKVPVDLNTFESHLLPEDESEVLYIQGHMAEDAGNEYQEKNLTGLGITVVATQYTHEYDSEDNTYDEDATYPEIKSAAKITEVFPDLKDKDGNAIDFGVTAPAKDISIDGQGVATVTGFADYWFAGDVTIKGVTFQNGACFTAKDAGTTGTITFEDCTFYGCDQSKIDLKPYEYNALQNSGAGMCLNIDTKDSPNLKVVVKNCAFIGEDDTSLNRNGWNPVGGQNWNADTATKWKSRGHAVMINGISGGGNNAQAESVLIEGCTMSGIRGHAIQLHSLRMGVTIKDCKIKSWGRNAQTAAGTETDAAIRGDIAADSTNGSLTLENNYFGLDESSNILHVKVNSFSGNTAGDRTAGTY